MDNKMQGQSARQVVPLLILRCLLKKELTFEELVTSIPHSRGTVNKYLNELYEKGFVDRKGRGGKYHLSSKGKKEIMRQGAKKLQQDVESAKEAYNEYVKNVVQLSQEGHAKILTKEEINKIKFPTLGEIPVELDKEGVNRLGINNAQIATINLLQKVVENLEKKGKKAVIMVDGKKGKYFFGTKKKLKKVDNNE